MPDSIVYRGWKPRSFLRLSQFIFGVVWKRFSEIVICASKGGADDSPQWYHNIRAAETVDVQIATQAFRATWREPVDTEPHSLTDFDREVDALRQLLSARNLMSVDELRRGIEAIPEADYLRPSYYQRWIRSITDNLLVKGVITEVELRAALERV